MDHHLEVFDQNINSRVTVSKQFLSSKTVISTLLLFAGVLLLAAYIEVYITPEIAESVVMIFD
jgi:uncharacterized membrane protein SpoIIM required for sporulation